MAKPAISALGGYAAPLFKQDPSDVGSLNDNWVIQERKLSLAEILESVEDIPEQVCRLLFEDCWKSHDHVS